MADQVVVLLGGAGLWLAGLAPAVAVEWGPYQAQYIRNYDGDTVTLSAHIWRDIVIHDNFRLIGLDTPEIRGECEREKRRAQAAKEKLQELMTAADMVFVTVYGFGKYGRPLASIEAAGVDVNQSMIDSGHARPYDGGVRLSWCGAGS